MSQEIIKNKLGDESEEIEGFVEFNKIITRSFLDDNNFLKNAFSFNGADLGICLDSYEFIEIKSVRYRERKDIRYQLCSLYSILQSSGLALFYVLSKNDNNLALYFGFPKETEGTIQSALKGILAGCEFSVMKPSPITNSEKFRYASLITGIPSEKKSSSENNKNTSFDYGIERLVDSISDEQFSLIIYAKPIPPSKAAEQQKLIADLVSAVHPFTKYSQQISQGIQKGGNRSVSEQTSDTKSKGKTEGSSESAINKPWLISRWVKGVRNFLEGGKSPTKTQSTQTTIQVTASTTSGTTSTIGESTSETFSESETKEIVDHYASHIEEILKQLHNRIKDGIGEGLWKVSVFFASDTEHTVKKGCNILKGIWGGAYTYLDPIRVFDFNNKNNDRNSIADLLSSTFAPLGKEHPLGEAYSALNTWLTSTELAIQANIPYYELPFIAVEKMVDYGRHLPILSPDPSERSPNIVLGKLVDKNIESSMDVNIQTPNLNRHLFVTGMTGSGKSNTIRAMLLELCRLNIPFLILEPAKTEYAQLASRIAEMHRKKETKFSSLLVHKLGHGNLFSINPFSFEMREGLDPALALTSHIDRLKAVFNASLGMYSSMPYILEDIVYKAYTQAGWDLVTGKNLYFEKAREYLGFDKLACEKSIYLRDLFLPRLSDLANLVDPVIKDFFPSQTDYGTSLVGALKSRLNSLTRGAKGRLLNQRASVSAEHLLNNPCVIELESFTDNDEKAFVMALLLSRIYAYREGKPSDSLKHILVIEEAHRLLSKPPHSAEHSSNSKGKSVEVFADMLAEIRAYGQGIVIADQIPSKLIPDVLKNTDVKIVHRLVAKDDREAVGCAMNLDEEQIKDLSRSAPGRATLSFQGLNNPLRVQIKEIPLNSLNSQIPPITKSSPPNALQDWYQLCFSEKQPLSISERPECYRLVLKTLGVALFCWHDEDVLIQWRSQLTQGRNPQVKQEELWATLAGGIHVLFEEMVRSGIPVGQAGIFTASVGAFLRNWGAKDATAYKKELECFLKLAEKPFKGSDNMPLAPPHYIAYHIQSYVDFSGLSQSVCAILKDLHSTDYSALQDILNEAVEDITAGMFNKSIKPFSWQFRVKLYGYLIGAIRTDNEVYQAKLGLAYGNTRKLLELQKISTNNQ